MKIFLSHLFILASLLLFSSTLVRAESQGGDYKGITDPFADPTAYEFSEDEKNDKEFFHLGRFLMLGLDLGLGSYTGGLGENNESAFLAGAHLVYFFDKSLAFEGRGAYLRHLSTQSNQAATIMIPVNFGFRFYPDVKNSPRPIALANPYLALGGGLYIRKSDSASPTAQTSTNNMGAYFGGGLQFLIYRRHIYFGADMRYHLVYFNDESLGTSSNPDAGSGNYFTTAFSITYNF